jgi:hypothetical protein
MTSDKSKSTSNHSTDDEQSGSSIPEAPDVPEGGIPDLDESENTAPGKRSSQEAQEEQDRQVKSGEENPG